MPVKIAEYKKLLRESELEREFAAQYRFYDIPAPVREYEFALPRKFRFDFAWPDRMVAVELEGGAFTSGRHTRGTGFDGDCEKYNLAILNGWKLFRFTNAKEALVFMKDYFRS